MWSKKPTPVAMSEAPVPSRSIATSRVVSLVLRVIAPLRMVRADCDGSLSARLLASRKPIDHRPAGIARASGTLTLAAVQNHERGRAMGQNAASCVRHSGLGGEDAPP